MAYCRAFILVFVYLTLVFAALATDTLKQECDEKKCRGPLRYYDDLQCEPEYDVGDDCCPARYNCSHLSIDSGFGREFCYVDGVWYPPGVRISLFDANPCEIGCVCKIGKDGIPDFNCDKAVRCPEYVPSKVGCMQLNAIDSCCPKVEICPQFPNDTYTCTIDGQEYAFRSYFVPQNAPYLTCVCLKLGVHNLKAYGVRVIPVAGGVCAVQRRPFFSDIHAAYRYHMNCTPIYDTTADRITGNKRSWICGNTIGKSRKIYRGPNNWSVSQIYKNSNVVAMCKLGKMKMNIGNTIYRIMHVCVECLCEIPPAPTCQVVSMETCTGHFGIRLKHY